MCCARLRAHQDSAATRRSSVSRSTMSIMSCSVSRRRFASVRPGPDLGRFDRTGVIRRTQRDSLGVVGTRQGRSVDSEGAAIALLHRSDHGGLESVTNRRRVVDRHVLIMSDHVAALHARFPVAIRLRDNVGCAVVTLLVPGRSFNPNQALLAVGPDCNGGAAADNQDHAAALTTLRRMGPLGDQTLDAGSTDSVSGSRRCRAC